ncbi:MAG: CoA activase, partial [Acidobacteria bacterium]|nr:CoA activase [Acidobacteriota bacterium]
MAARYCIGLDVGSVTVKLAVFDEGPQPIWSRYERHGTKQPECVLEMLQTCEAELPGLTGAPARIFLTGSGGLALAPLLGGRFVQEVHAVALAVERLHPECGSAVELGGQDAKILIFQTDPSTGRRSRITSMNDKCAGGTGAVIDKLGAKLGIAKDELGAMPFHGLKLHPVAGKCGVFAETDIVGLQKQGVPREELIASLFQAIVMQNLSVLTRGNLLRPEVLLLGGPNCYLRGLRECWETAIPLLWAERGVDLPRDVDPVSLIRVPANGHLFAAIGAVEFGRRQEEDAASYLGWRTLEQHLRRRPAAGPASSLTDSADQLRQLGRQFSIREFVPATFRPGEVVEAFLGVDGGSTSTKAVLLSKTRPRQVLAKSYRLSHGNPIDDAKGVVGDLEHYVRAQGAQLRILGAGTTGYAREMLRTALSADIALVETVAHTEAALHFHPDVDVICDVGGQDIKIIILKDGKVSDFRLNTQCSAGNGYFLQSTAESFGIRVSDIAEVALAARRSPDFGSGCAVFLQTDIVNFQRQGWKPDEILAGLCRVLPRNIWLYVAQLPNLSGLGRYFLLQGGTQHNLAAVKAQADFIRSRFPAGDQPQVVVHEHCGEAGAIGAALEAARLWGRGRETGFVGLDSLAALTYSTRRDEST